MTSVKKSFYTGKGDSGVTEILNHKRVKKSDEIMHLLGSIDELTAFIGLAISFSADMKLKTDLRSIQSHLSKIMGVLADVQHSELPGNGIRTYIKDLEEMIDAYGENVDFPKQFVFPGNTQLGAIMDICRTVARKIERLAVGHRFDGTDQKKIILSYLNRLSSFFFVLRLLSEEFLK